MLNSVENVHTVSHTGSTHDIDTNMKARESIKNLLCCTLLCNSTTLH